VNIKAFLLLFLFSGVVLSESESVVLESADVKVTAKELEYYFNDRLPPLAKSYAITQRKTYKESLENIYLIKHFSSLAKKNGLLRDDSTKWVADLERDRVLMKFYISNFVDARFKKIDWDAMAKEEYLANKSNYSTEERVKASHILIKTEGRNKAEAMELTSKVRAMILDGGSFVELAKQYSEDEGSKNNGGSLGYFERSNMVKPFADKAFAMSVESSVSEPVESMFGFHLIQYNGRIGKGVRAFDEVKEGIIKIRKKELKSKIHKDLVFAAKTSGDFNINEIEVDALKSRLTALSN